MTTIGAATQYVLILVRKDEAIVKLIVEELLWENTTGFLAFNIMFTLYFLSILLKVLGHGFEGSAGGRI